MTTCRMHMFTYSRSHLLTRIHNRHARMHQHTHAHAHIHSLTHSPHLCPAGCAGSHSLPSPAVKMLKKFFVIEAMVALPEMGVG